MKKHFFISYLLIISCWVGTLHAAPSLTEIGNTLYINWYDNPLRSSDFHDEILHSIEKDDSLFMNQLMEHKIAQNKKMMISAAHIKAAIARNRYDILNREDTAFTPGAIDDDAPLMKALDILKNAQDIKVVQDTVAQDASFFVGRMFQQKKNYSARLLQKIADAFPSKEGLQYVTRHVHDLQKNIENCVAHNNYNEWQERSCQLAVRYGALNPSMTLSMFRNGVTPALHITLLRYCKNELRDEVPNMSYEDKKRYVNDNYHELIKILSDDQASELVMETLSLPALLGDPVVKKGVLEVASKVDNIIDILDRLLPAPENPDPDNRQPRQYYEQCMKRWTLDYDVNAVDVVRAMPLSEEDCRILEQKIKNALENNEYQIVDAIFTLCPSLSNKDAKEIEPLLEEIRQKYKVLQEVWTSHKLSEKFLVAPLNKGTLDSLWHTVFHTLFFDRMLGHIAYGLTKSKIRNSTSDNPFVQKVFADDHNADKPDYDQDGIRAACAHPLMVKEALTYLDYLIDRYEYQNNRADKCPICLEPYSALAFKGKIPQDGSDVPQTQSKRRIGITYCNESHAMCVACCNHPDVSACPICRDPLDIKEKISVCQNCTTGFFTSADLRFIHCKECDSVGVLCTECTQMPCCRKEIVASDTADKAPILDHVKALTKKLDENLVNDLRAAFENYIAQVNAHAAEWSHEAARLKERVGASAEQLNKLNSQIEAKKVFLTNPHSLFYLKYLREHNNLVREYNDVLAEHGALQATIAKRGEGAKLKSIRLEQEHAQRRAWLMQSHKALVDALKALIR